MSLGGDGFLQLSLFAGARDDIGFRLGITDDDHFSMASISGSSGATTPVSFDAAGSSVEMSADLTLLDRQLLDEPTHVHLTAHGIEFGEHWCLGISGLDEHGVAALSLTHREGEADVDTTAMLWRTDGSWLDGPVAGAETSCWAGSVENQVTLAEDHTFIAFNGLFRVGSTGLDEQHHAYLSLVGSQRTAVVYRDDGLVLRGPRDDYQWLDWPPPRNASGTEAASAASTWPKLNGNLFVLLLLLVVVMSGCIALFYWPRRSDYVLVKVDDSEAESLVPI